MQIYELLDILCMEWVRKLNKKVNVKPSSL